MKRLSHRRHVVATASRFAHRALLCSLTFIGLFAGAPVSAEPEVEAQATPETLTETPPETVPEKGDFVAPPPIGVRFGQPLEGPKFRVHYSFERVQKQGLMISDENISPSEIFDNVPPSPVYARSPRSFSLTTHTFQLAYAAHSRATLVVEVPFLQKELESVANAAGRPRSEVQTEGVGDVVFALVVPFIKKGNESSHVHISIDVPTGSIRRGGDDLRLPLDLQIGNGTVDLAWGWTYRGHANRFSWGGQVVGNHPVGRNGLDYREGSRFEVSLWTAALLWKGLSASVRMDWQKQNNTRVRRRVTNASIVDPSDNPRARGGTRYTVSPGLSLELPKLRHQRLSVEVGIPFYQELDGPQLEQDWSVKAGWQWEF